MKPRELVCLPEMESLDCDIPPRSILYRIPAMGHGTGQVEGLLSYLVRVARAHSVNPRRLVRTVFASDNPVFGQLRYARFFAKGAGTIDGLGKYADLFHEEISRLTGASFLRHMSLLPLKDLLPPNGAGMLVSRPKWCACCVGEMMESGSEVYRPLVWSLELYRVCVRHGGLLQEVCANCGYVQPFIPRYPDLGRCDHCGGNLGDGEKHQSTAKLDLWVSAAVSDLVQHLPEIDGLATAERFVDFVKGVEERVVDGNRAKFCELIGLPRWALTGWLTHGEKPTLPQFLSTCYRLNLMPSELFLGESEQVLRSVNSGIRPIPEKLIAREARPLLSVKERQRLAVDLSKIVNDTEDVRSLLAVAKQFGVTTSCIKYWYPEESAIILSKYDGARKLRTDARMQAEREVVNEVVHAIRERGEYPSIRKVNAALRSHKMSLVRKDLLRVYRQAMAQMESYT